MVGFFFEAILKVTEMSFHVGCLSKLHGNLGGVRATDFYEAVQAGVPSVYVVEVKTKRKQSNMDVLLKKSVNNAIAQQHHGWGSSATKAGVAKVCVRPNASQVLIGLCGDAMH